MIGQIKLVMYYVIDYCLLFIFEEVEYEGELRRAENTWHHTDDKLLFYCIIKGLIFEDLLIECLTNEQEQVRIKLTIEETLIVALFD